ncbi:MAG: protein arginine kinase [Thermoanaerobacterales bacterium]|nr:protein arginine kinase [Bacillota bacterium]MDI6907544.1 protein arginine kinase [Thermoanaerobacterales bacterium]
MGFRSTVNNPYSRWMDDRAPETDVAVSSRIRLARALQGFPFPHRLPPERAEEVVHAVRLAIGDEQVRRAAGAMEIATLAELAPVERQILVEKHLASPAVLEEGNEQGRAVALSEDETVSILVNEEDHIRLQVLLPGLQLEAAWRLADRVDDALEKTLDYAYDERLGYLTACPTNVGTGLRASVMVHLPALALTGQARELLTAVSKLGMTVRGLYGEGTEAKGYLFQLSNQVTLGYGEEEIVKNLTGVTLKVIEQERAARRLLLKESGALIEDRSWRALGLLKHARRLSSDEALRFITDIRLGVDLGIIKNLPIRVLNELMVLTRPACVTKAGGEEGLTPGQRDELRAKLVREKLADFKIGD